MATSTGGVATSTGGVATSTEGGENSNEVGVITITTPEDKADTSGATTCRSVSRGVSSGRRGVSSGGGGVSSRRGGFTYASQWPCLLDPDNLATAWVRAISAILEHPPPQTPTSGGVVTVKRGVVTANGGSAYRSTSSTHVTMTHELGGEEAEKVDGRSSASSVVTTLRSTLGDTDEDESGSRDNESTDGEDVRVITEDEDEKEERDISTVNDEW